MRHDVIGYFRTAMLDAGLACRGEIIPDGTLHRFYVEGDRRGTRNGWYILHTDGLPAGAFGSWKLGLSQAWCAKDKVALSHAERLEYRARLDDIKRQREAELTDRRTKSQGMGLGHLASCSAGRITPLPQPKAGARIRHSPV
jgi:putative DNA primase/helicase